MNTDPLVMKHFLSVMTNEQSDALVDRIEATFDAQGWGLFALERKSDGAFLGFTGFAAGAKGTPVSEDIEIGWRIARDFWRHGFAYEAARACLDWFWPRAQVARLVSYTSLTNLPSQALMGKLGFERDASLDFDHPAIPKDNPVCRQVVTVSERHV